MAHLLPSQWSPLEAEARDVELIIPWSGGCPHRERALEWVLARSPYRATVAPGPTPWVKAAAVTPAVERSTAEIVVLHDADVWCDGLSAAVHAVREGAPYAIPHQHVHRLTEQATEAWLSGRSDMTCEQEPYVGIFGGGIVVASREVIRSIPLDSRFVGWG